ncbi:hypothetical protein [Flavihumibacter petaseus]|uniref:Uncharacterized protein n=1 Tax=Flavihumibacter petaseus NBRC 106054 TaxID=1220578 RepID=A0A0E9N1F1_9BACT|nr:hypothetical protein [Flavihumibacter petaseus]GAO43598.1 hypothetical protein FPE01S_02_07040 [Flavihumibacter petaseus NBRC 106054]
MPAARCLILLLLLLPALKSRAQADSTTGRHDTTIVVDRKIVTLKEVIVHRNMDVPSFIRRIQFDTSFYRAFKNLHEVSYTALNDVRLFDGKDNQVAGLESRTRQTFDQGCRYMTVLEEHPSGDIRNRRGEWNYYTMSMYAGLFFTADTTCGEDNSVQAADLSLKGKRGLEKHKEQLKMLFFNPGKKIPGIPFIGDKINIYEPPQADLYNFEIDMMPYQGNLAYVFRIYPREGLSEAQKDQLVFNEITTWFDETDMRIIGRKYDLSYDTGLYDFDVQMEVSISRKGDLLLPTLLRYTGTWKYPFKKRETGVFTATLFDFQ